MIHLKWNIIGAALALTVLLTACGADFGAGTGANTDANTDADVGVNMGADAETQAPETAQQPVEMSEPVEEPIPWVTDIQVEPWPVEPVEEPFVPCTVGLMPESEPVAEEWFADAVFLGDSRTDGLHLYSGMKDATFFSYKGLSVFSIDSKECITLGEEKVTVLQALAREQYAKVYIMLGINELSYTDGQKFKDAYTELVIAVREIQPDADIYLQLQPPVNEKVAKAKGLSENITNERVELFNALIAEVAEEQETGLVNVWETLADEEGSLPAELTSDGVHMKREGYEIWYTYLRSHTGTMPPIVEESEEGIENGEPELPGDVLPPGEAESAEHAGNAGEDMTDAVQLPAETDAAEMPRASEEMPEAPEQEP